MSAVEILEPEPSTPRPERPITAKQLATLDWIRQYIAQYGYAPSVRDIAHAFGIRSTNAVHEQLKALERKGYLRRRGVASRAMVVITKPGEQPGDVAVSYREENEALRTLLRRMVAAVEASPTLSAKMALTLGDVRKVLR